MALMSVVHQKLLTGNYCRSKIALAASSDILIDDVLYSILALACASGKLADFKRAILLLCVDT